MDTQTGTTLTEQPMGILDRIKAAGAVLAGGRLPNPLAEPSRDMSRAALVSELNDWCKAERAFWQPTFKRIRELQKFAAGKQWRGDYQCASPDDRPYIGDTIQQLLNRKTASLYAKNPTPLAQRVDRLTFAVWDGTQASLNGAKAILQAATPILQQAQMALVQGVPMPPPPPEIEQAQSIVRDYEAGMAQKAMFERIGKTGTKLIEHRWRTQNPEFKASMKQLVTRILTSRVGYIKVMYRRDMSEATQGVTDTTMEAKMQRMASLMEQFQKGEITSDSAEAGELELMLGKMQQTVAGDVTEEGCVIDFLSATSVIVDRRCTCLKEFVGAHRIAHELIMTVADAEAKFGVSLRDTGAVIYSDRGLSEGQTSRIEDNYEQTRSQKKVCIWHILDKNDQMCYVVCDGVKNFLKEPYEPTPKLKRFWDIVPVRFNVLEVEENLPEEDVTIYGRSDIDLAEPMQRDINQAGEGLREHRIANRPWWVANGNRWMEKDLLKLSQPRKPHDVLRIESLNVGEKVGDFIQAGPQQPITREMYDPAGSMQAMMLATGVQAADLGSQRPDEKATGQKIAANALAVSQQSDVDELDFSLGMVAQMIWEMEIQETSPETVKRIVGDGAAWPEISRADVANEIYFEVEAGSSGRPNQAQEVENYQLIAPMLQQQMQASGMSLEPLIKEGVRRLGDKLDVDEFLKPAQVQPPQPMAPGQPPGPQSPTAPPQPAGMQPGLPNTPSTLAENQ